MKFSLPLILDFFKSRHWTVASEDRLFIYLKPSKYLDLPNEFLLELPKDENLKGFNKYISRFIEGYAEMFPENYRDELELLFSEKTSIIKYRIFDPDNVDGTIGLNKFVNSIDAFKDVLEDAVSFTVNKKPIFGQTQSETTEYFRNCRVMQSVKGSFVNRFEIQSRPLMTTFGEITTDQVNEKLFDVIEFIKEDVLVNVNRPNLTEEYIADNIEYVNYELIKSIKNVYSKPHISNIEYTLEASSYNKNIITERMTSKIKYFDNYLKSLKYILESLTSFETQGYIINLNSTDPIKSDRNEVMIDVKNTGLKKPVKFYLRSEEYYEALDAHKNHYLIKIKGKAKELKSYIAIQELETFEIKAPN